MTRHRRAYVPGHKVTVTVETSDEHHESESEHEPVGSQDVGVLKGIDGPGEYDVTINVPVMKVDDEERVITSIVIAPEEVDAHDDVMDEKVAKSAAYSFLASYNSATQLGLNHTKFGEDIGLELVESYIAPVEFEMERQVVVSKGSGDSAKTKVVKQKVPKGAWVMSMRVTKDELWQDVKSGKYKGFSYQGIATVPA